MPFLKFHQKETAIIKRPALKQNKKDHITMIPHQASAGIEPAIEVLQTFALPLGHDAITDSTGNRTRVAAVKGRCLNLLTMEPLRMIS